MSLIYNISESKLVPSYHGFERAKITGQRTMCVTTMNPQSITEKGTLFLQIPALAPGDCLIPESIHLTCNLKNKNTKSCFLNKFSALLQEGVKVRFGKMELYNNDSESEFQVYKDLWLSDEDREAMVNQGIANENTRKLMSGDDSGAGTGNDQKVEDKMIADMYKDQLVIPIASEILGKHHLFCPHALDSTFEVELKLPAGSDIMKAQASQSIAGYELTNLNLRYEVIRNQEIYDQIEQSYITGETFRYRIVDRYETRKSDWVKGSTLVNTRVNIPRASMRFIAMFFKDDTKDSEKYVFPNITGVSVTINGKPNALFSGGDGKLDKAHMYKTALECFNPKRYGFVTLSQRKFFKDKFALVIDLRSLPDDSVILNGKRVINTQDGILLEINKTATAKDLTCKMFIVSDAAAHVQNKTVVSVEK